MPIVSACSWPSEYAVDAAVLYLQALRFSGLVDAACCCKSGLRSFHMALATFAPERAQLR